MRSISMKLTGMSWTGLQKNVTSPPYHPEEKLDEGFHCKFSFSGTLIEQLEKWKPDVLALFDQVARHRNTGPAGTDLLP